MPDTFQAIQRQVRQFEKQLNANQGVVIQFAFFGKPVEFFLGAIRDDPDDPNLLVFIGEDLHEPEPARVVQHVDLLAFALVSMQRKNAKEPKEAVKFGFARDLS